MSPKPTDAQKKRNAAAAVKAALAEGKITDQSLPAWRQAYERNPEATRAELRQLVAPKIYVPGSASAPVSDNEARLLESTRKVLGVAPAAASTPSAATPPPSAAPPRIRGGGLSQSQRGALAQAQGGGQGATDFGLNRGASPKGGGIPAPGSVDPLTGQPATGSTGRRQFTPASDPLSHAPAAPQPAARAAVLTRTEHGSVLYGGVPTCMSDRGTRQVYYYDGWVDVAEFEARGFTPQDSAVAINFTQKLGTPETQATLAAGLPPGSALGVV